MNIVQQGSGEACKRNSEHVDITVVLDGNLGVAYVNNEVAMNFRAYDLPEGNWGVYANGGTVWFDQLAMSTL